MKYSLIITQTVNDEDTVTAVDADGEVFNDALVLHYIFDGAEYRLEIGESQMSQLRLGSVRLSMSFIEGRTTVSRFDDGTVGGEFPVFTRKLSVQFDGTDCKAACEFSLGDCGEVTNLSVIASVLQ